MLVTGLPNRYELGVAVKMVIGVEALHANLPKYGLEWHKEPMEGIWDDWLQPYLGKELSSPELQHSTVPPRWWVDEMSK